MNALVLYSWLSDYVDLKDISAEEFAKRISLSGPAVEKIYPQGLDWDQVVVGRIVEVQPHPQADKLRVIAVDVGLDQPLRIVCGGSNVKIGQWVPVAKIGARVKWHGEGDLVELKPIEIRGVASEGMICAANEIGLFDAFPHEEREILDLGMALPKSKWQAGQPLAVVLGAAGDALLDLEVTTNRVDAMGILGLARETAAIFGRKLLIKKPRALKVESGSEIAVRVDSAMDCPRYLAVRIERIRNRQTPWWMKRILLAAGIRPLHPIVDIANYVMLETAQPLHTFDADKVSGSIQVRRAKSGESLRALDGKTHALDESILVIADDRGPIAIAGVMGGVDSGISDKTTSIIIEAANFDPVLIRRGARKLQVQTDAQSRYEKGLSMHALDGALARAAELMQKILGGVVASPISETGKRTQMRVVDVGIAEASSLIGVPVPATEMVTTLKRLGFRASKQGKKIVAEIPWWREHDIEEGRDLVEEIARVRGYANIPAVMPFGLAPRVDDSELQWETKLRNHLKSAGYLETCHYSLISREMATRAGFDPESMLQVQNPLSDEFAVMRTSLFPSLLQTASENRERAATLRLSEIANVYLRKDSDAVGPWSDLPDEQLECAGILVGGEDLWREAKGVLESVFDQFGVRGVEWKRQDQDSFWHPGRTAQVWIEGKWVATVGEVSPVISDRYKLPRTALFHLRIAALAPFLVAERGYTALSQFPEAKRDLAVVVDRHVEFASLDRLIRNISPLIRCVEWFDTFAGESLPIGKKSVAMHVNFSAEDRTLSNEEVDALMEKAVLALKESVQAELR